MYEYIESRKLKHFSWLLTRIDITQEIGDALWAAYSALNLVCCRCHSQPVFALQGREHIMSKRDWALAKEHKSEV